MHILLTISGRGPTGAAAAALTDARALTLAGARVLAATKMGVDPLPISRALEAAGLRPEDHQFALKFPRGLAGLARLPRDVRRLAQHLQAKNVDLVHAHRTEEQWLAALALGSKTSAKLVRTWHRDPAQTPRPLLKLLARHAAGCVCVARAHADTLLEAGARRARFIHGAVDTAFFLPQAKRPGGKFVIGQSARWKAGRDSDRGQFLALDIFAQLPRDLNWVGELIGRGETETQLRHHAYEVLRLPPERVNIVNTRDFSAREFADRLSAFDLGLVFATGSDGASRPALEMLSSGVPLIVAPKPGLLEFSEHAASALMAPSTVATSEWASTISALLRAPPRLIAMQLAARQRALEAHTFKARGAALLKFYGECVISSR